MSSTSTQSDSVTPPSGQAGTGLLLLIDPDPQYFVVHTDSRSTLRHFRFEMLSGKPANPSISNVDGTVCELRPSDEKFFEYDAKPERAAVEEYMSSCDPNQWRLAGEMSFNLMNTLFDGKLEKVPTSLQLYRPDALISVTLSAGGLTIIEEPVTVKTMPILIWGGDQASGFEWRRQYDNRRPFTSQSARVPDDIEGVLGSWYNERCITVDISSTNGGEYQELLRQVLIDDRSDLARYLDTGNAQEIRAIKEIQGPSLTGTDKSSCLFDKDI